MKWFNNLRIATKLISAFVIVALIAGVLGVFGIYNMENVDTEYAAMYEDYGISLGNLGSAGMDFNAGRVKVANILLVDDRATKERLAAEIEELDAAIKHDFEEFRASIRKEETMRQFESLLQSFENYKTTRNRVIELSLSGQNDQAIALMTTEGEEIANATNSAINDMFEQRKTNGKNQAAALAAQTDTTKVTMIVTVVILFIVSILFGVVVSRMISKPVGKLVEAADRIADGDLDVNVDIESKDEIGQLADAFRKMSDNLNEIMSNIQTASDQVAAGARQISELSVSLSQGATEQASSVEQLTASIEEISSQTQQNADSSNQANELAEAAKRNALNGNTQMKEMLNAMDEINLASQNISKIIKVIDEIAFQTNILALNAAVEAARAGQHGKGFAVVAEEVRNLAARSANAAKETTELIEGSIRKADTGTKIAQETANALQQIVDDVSKVAALVDSIATASNEQAIGINQINQGIMQVSQVVQQTSANLEEGAATSEELSAQANLLNDQVRRFKLRRVHGGYPQSVNDRQAAAVSQDAMPEPVAKVRHTKIALSDHEFGKYSS
ncbi:MAG: methyl-accepting chemotaxis protein [Thermobacillus sp.]|uniref:methyl-accepting chemotaxis protein n=1 Tax=Thermobacillus sp. TaxID=2108467 RepID=UPI000E3B4063|nr:methyl-accepting chemotaxis protein [Thermobacillus sp.]REK56581.1 MAG: methyl-accepting chemotaxis protein [Thermobacillus sp.]